MSNANQHFLRSRGNRTNQTLPTKRNASRNKRAGAKANDPAVKKMKGGRPERNPNSTKQKNEEEEVEDSDDAASSYESDSNRSSSPEPGEGVVLQPSQSSLHVQGGMLQQHSGVTPFSEGRYESEVEASNLLMNRFSDGMQHAGSQMTDYASQGANAYVNTNLDQGMGTHFAGSAYADLGASQIQSKFDNYKTI